MKYCYFEAVLLLRKLVMLVLLFFVTTQTTFRVRWELCSMGITVQAAILLVLAALFVVVSLGLQPYEASNWCLAGKIVRNAQLGGFSGHRAAV